MDRASSPYARLLATSGFLGVATSFGLRLWAELLLDPVVYGVSLPPDWVEPIALALFVGSVAVVLYALVLDDLFPGWGDVVAVAGVLAQWGLPAGLLLVEEQLVSPYVRLLVLASGFLHALLAVVVAAAVAARGP